MKKKIVSLLLAAVMTLSLVACGSGNDNKADDSNADASAAPAATAAADADKDAAPAEDSGEEVTLSLMVTTRPTTDNKDFYLDWLPELVKEKYPNINIEVEQLPTDQYKQTVKLKFASGQGPDIFTWWAGLQAQDLVDAGYVRDMSDFSQLGKFSKSIEMCIRDRY